jgi:hypothetical protein
MISTCVPEIFVRSQLFPIPGEERKFRRRRIVAFVPDCRRERDLAASHAAIADGLSSPAVGVDVASITGGAIGVSGFVEVGGGGDSVGVDSIVPVGDGSEVGVDSVAGLTVWVAEERGVTVVPEALAVEGESIDLTAGVSVMDMEVAGMVGESALRVAAEREGTNPGGGSAVDPGARA